MAFEYYFHKHTHTHTRMHTHNQSLPEGETLFSLQLIFFECVCGFDVCFDLRCTSLLWI